MQTALIFTGGESQPPSVVDELPEADIVIAADSGYDLAVGLGVAVDVLIGDLDSLINAPGRHVIVEPHPRDKDQTDLELALERLLPESPARVVVIGGSGGRIDHEIGTALLLASERWADFGELDWVSRRGVAHVIRGRRLIHADVGDTVSLIPVGGAASGVRTKGLEWDLIGETLAPGTTRGISNRFRLPIADILVGHGALLAVIPSDQPARPANTAESSAS